MHDESLEAVREIVKCERELADPQRGTVTLAIIERRKQRLIAKLNFAELCRRLEVTNE